MSNINFLPPSNFNKNLHVFSTCISTFNIISFNQKQNCLSQQKFIEKKNIC